MAEPVQTSNKGSPTQNWVPTGDKSPVGDPSALGDPSPDKNVGKGPPPAEPRRCGPESQAVDDYVRRLSEEHKMLIALKAQLYGGSWEPMLDDLRNRLAGKPYIFKLVHRIQDDIERIEEMQKFEAEHQIDLAEYVDS